MLGVFRLGWGWLQTAGSAGAGSSWELLIQFWIVFLAMPVFPVQVGSSCITAPDTQLSNGDGNGNVTRQRFNEQSSGSAGVLNLCTFLCRSLQNNRRLKQRRCRRRERPLVENEFMFYQQNSRLSRSVRYANGSIIVLRLNMQWHRPIPNENTTFSIDDEELIHFTF